MTRRSIEILNKSKPFVIALCGRMRSGKDTLADYLVDNYNFEKVKFASHLKDIVKLAFDLTDEDVETSKKDMIHEGLQVKPRKLMDFIGTQVFQYDVQNVLPNLQPRCFWTNSLINKIKDKERVVISDLRFVHEYERLNENYENVLIIKIERKKNDIDTSSYISEQEIDKILTILKLSILLL
tara:strand:- start:666 stop:1211 length:546 start_codon:yes stop_codon:yes gene_type:complete